MHPLRLEDKPKRAEATLTRMYTRIPLWARCEHWSEDLKQIAYAVTLTKNGADDGEHMVRGSSTLNAERELYTKYVLPNPEWSEGRPYGGVITKQCLKRNAEAGNTQHPECAC